MTRPFDLDPLFRAVTTLPGIGPRNGIYLERLIGGPKVWDALCHLPIDIIDRSYVPDLADAKAGEIATLSVTVVNHMPSPKKNLPYKIACKDNTGAITLVFFHANRDWLAKQFPKGHTVIVSGKIETYQGKLQMVHPDRTGKPEELNAIARVEPVYPLTSGITNKTVTKAIQNALAQLPRLPEWLEKNYKTKNALPDWHKALEQVHNPDSALDILPDSKARQRLAYDELLANQLALGLVRLRQKKKKGRAFPVKGNLRQKLLDALPFELTEAQSRCLEEIDLDMGSDDKMLRLLQGDVGSGKTVVAALAMLSAVENRTQAALMAPTEILARQHAQTLIPLLENAGVSSVVLTGRDKGKPREQIVEQIENGQANVVIGTHALFQKDIHFKDLGLAVIDEQHRFGVHQRMQLSSKSKGVDVLVMTATPIPRTLTLTAYGDMEVSRIDKKPPGRKPVDTRLLSQERIGEMIESLKKKIETGSRVYWVCPLVEESDVLDVSAAQERFEILESIFGDRVGLVHGKMKPTEKDEVMQNFVEGNIDILVATTVIEVGVNVPEATIMVIEHAERFGLAQLHQLRGRVGRGADKSFCFLVYASKLSDTAKERLRTMRETDDGFIIAEKDLKLRGGGEVLGTRQSGLPEFRLADISTHDELLMTARDDAKMILDQDPELQSKRGQALKTLLYLFERDQAIQFLQSG